MAIKKYSSYSQIEFDLEVLKLQKEIHFQKLLLSGQIIKESLTPSSLVSSLLGSFKEVLINPRNAIIKLAIPFIIKLILKIKRGI